MDPLFPIKPESLEDLTDEALQAFIDQSLAAAKAIRDDPASYLAQGYTAPELVTQMRAGVEAMEAARAERARRQQATEEALAEIEALAEQAAEQPAEQPAAEGEAVEEEEGEQAAAEERAEQAAEEPVQAGATSKPSGVAAPARARSAEPRPEPVLAKVTLTAAADLPGYSMGDPIPDERTVAELMVRKRRQFDRIPEGVRDHLPIAAMEWGHLYPPERRLGHDEVRNLSLVASAIDQEVMRRELERRRTQAITASGGLCAPATPYYQLQLVSQAARPLRASLPAFGADRGGIRFVRPPALTGVTTAVGVVSEAEDRLGGTFAAKTCQAVSCPTVTEVDVSAVYHCVQFGNLTTRAFPEMVETWNQLVMAAHARTAEQAILDAIAANSTAVTASNAMGLGVSAMLPSEILAAASGMRSRHRMDQDAVLRVLLPDWVRYFFLSDLYRSQFGRFDMSLADFVTLLRSNNVEPTFYLDSETGAGQVFGAQAAGALNAFPSSVVWYLFPEGSFIFLDGGSLEIGLVRDSVLNETNDYQIFGETFEAVAFVGVESLKVTSTLCDSGKVAAATAVTNCGSYA